MRSVLTMLKSFLAALARSFGISTPEPKPRVPSANGMDGKPTRKNDERRS